MPRRRRSHRPRVLRAPSARQQCRYRHRWQPVADYHGALRHDAGRQPPQSFLMMRYAVPEIAKAGGGAIVNVSSLAAMRSNSQISYEATKAALLGLSRSAAVSHARDNIRVNTILPGLIDSSMVRRLVGDRESTVAPRIPMRRQGTPWEIANAIVFLLSDDASYITGTELIVDGGLAAR